MKQDDETVQDIGDDEREGESENTRESTISSDIDEDNVDHQQEALLRVQARREKSLWTTRVPWPKKRSHADTVIARHLLPNSRQPPGSMAAPSLKC